MRRPGAGQRLTASACAKRKTVFRRISLVTSFGDTWNRGFQSPTRVREAEPGVEKRTK
jgi:hypothetical protein